MIRIYKRFRELLDAPVAEAGKFLRWKSDGTIENADIDLAADNISYTYVEDTSVNSVQAALDKLLYVAPQITSFTNSIGTVEIGQTIASVTLNWSLNKAMSTVTLTDVGAITPTSTVTKLLTGLNLTGNKSYTLTAGDGASTVSRSTTISFAHKRYWGVSATTNPTSADVLALSQEFASGKGQGRSMDGQGKYLYFAYPASWGDASFKVNGLQSTAWTKSVIAFTNASGNTTNFNVYRSNTIQNGTGIQVEVS